MFFDSYSLFVNAFCEFNSESYVNVVGMRLKLMMFAGVLVIVGLALFFYGTSMSNHLMNPESLIS